MEVWLANQSRLYYKSAISPSTEEALGAIKIGSYIMVRLTFWPWLVTRHTSLTFNSKHKRTNLGKHAYYRYMARFKKLVAIDGKIIDIQAVSIWINYTWKFLADNSKTLNRLYIFMELMKTNVTLS